MLRIGAGCVTIFISPQPLSCYPKASHHVFAAAFIWKGGPVSRFIGGFGERSSEERSRPRSEEHTPELQSPYAISYAVFCLEKINLISCRTCDVRLRRLPGACGAHAS